MQRRRQAFPGRRSMGFEQGRGRAVRQSWMPFRHHLPDYSSCSPKNAPNRNGPRGGRKPNWCGTLLCQQVRPFTARLWCQPFSAGKAVKPRAQNQQPQKTKPWPQQNWTRSWKRFLVKARSCWRQRREAECSMKSLGKPVGKESRLQKS